MAQGYMAKNLTAGTNELTQVLNGDFTIENLTITNELISINN